MALLKYLSCFAIVILGLAQVQAVSEKIKAQVREKVRPNVEACKKELNIQDKATEAGILGAAPSLDPCFTVCVYKKGGFINEKGFFVTAKAYELSKQFLKDPVDIKNSNAVIEECAQVNSKDVSDSDSGCERGRLLAECFVKIKDKFWS